MGIWTGDAAQNFNRSYENQNKNFNDFKNLINDVGTAIVSASGVLDETEQQNASSGAKMFG